MLMCIIIKFSTQFKFKDSTKIYIQIQYIYIILYMSPQPLRGKWCAQCLVRIAHSSLPTLGIHNHHNCVAGPSHTLGSSGCYCQGVQAISVQLAGCYITVCQHNKQPKERRVQCVNSSKALTFSPIGSPPALTSCEETLEFVFIFVLITDCQTFNCYFIFYLLVFRESAGGVLMCPSGRHSCRRARAVWCCGVCSMTWSWCGWTA